MNNTSVSITRADGGYVTVNGRTRVYPSILVQSSRVIKGKKVKINRRFHGTTFGTIANARNEAEIFAEHVKEFSNERFIQARRPRGRSRASHYYARATI